MTDAARSWRPIEVPGAPDAVGAYSRAARAGNLLFVSGQVPRSFETGDLLGADIAAQTRATLANLRRVLEAADASLDDVVAMTVYLQHAHDWPAFDAVCRAELRPPYPTRTVVGADLREVLVEITATAHLPGG
jgi:2-iminobutanoate/2-iminopropanoate deaminase